MALAFGDQLTDVSEDEDALAEFLALTREREEAAYQGREPRGPVGSPFDLPTDDEGVDYLVDPDPGYERRSLADTLIPDGVGDPSGKGPGVAIRKDITGKTALMLSMAGAPWAMRDPCGQVFLDAVPNISSALADIFCDSPDIVRWFTASGKYMKWLTLVGTLQPVVAAIGRHHILKKDADNATEAQPDWSAYGVGD